MPRMVPFPMLPTESAAERRLYEGFLDQLADDYVVYHSIPWVLRPDPRRSGGPDQGEADFLIAHAVDGLLVIEVKGGELTFDPATRRWSQAGREGMHELAKDPFQQASDEMHALMDILSHQPGWDRWRPAMGFAVAFPDGRYTRDAHPGAPAELVVDHDDLDRLAERVKQIMAAVRARHPRRRFGAEGMAVLERTLGFRVEIRTPLRLLFQEEDRMIVELTGEQSYVLSTLAHQRRAAVVGPAGSGKTVLAFTLARRFADGGTPTLLTCFNWRLARHLQEDAKDLDALEVVHFHELCRRMAREAGLTVPPEPAGTVPNDPYYEEVLPNLLADASSRLGPRYGAMVVDEAQDFREGWWLPLLTLHRNPDHGPLYLFADDNQNLYGGAVPAGLVGTTVPLTANLRNTQPIHEFVSVFHSADDPPKGRGPPGRPVEILGYRDEADLVHLLAMVLKNFEGEGVGIEDLVLLTPGRAERSALRRRGGVDGYRLSDDVERGTLLVCTVHGFKGLERPVVILAELGEHDRPRLGQLLYVGGSRAKNHLIVLAEESVARELRTLAGVART